VLTSDAKALLLERVRIRARQAALHEASVAASTPSKKRPLVTPPAAYASAFTGDAVLDSLLAEIDASVLAVKVNTRR
jgi:hypothetical protein